MEIWVAFPVPIWATSQLYVFEAPSVMLEVRLPNGAMVNAARPVVETVRVLDEVVPIFSMSFVALPETPTPPQRSRNW